MLIIRLSEGHDMVNWSKPRHRLPVFSASAIYGRAALRGNSGISIEDAILNDPSGLFHAVGAPNGVHKLGDAEKAAPCRVTGHVTSRRMVLDKASATPKKAELTKQSITLQIQHTLSCREPFQ